jgi:hypothetical protein
LLGRVCAEEEEVVYFSLLMVRQHGTARFQLNQTNIRGVQTLQLAPAEATTHEATLPLALGAEAGLMKSQTGEEESNGRNRTANCVASCADGSARCVL